MADTNNRKLDKVVKIDNFSYDVCAVEADHAAAATLATTAAKVTGTLTITKDGQPFKTFDGSESVELPLESAAATDVANKLNVTMTGTNTEGGVVDVIKPATITIKPEDPSGGAVGDIWFKY